MSSIFCSDLSHVVCKDSVARPLINHGASEQLCLFWADMSGLLNGLLALPADTVTRTRRPLSGDRVSKGLICSCSLDENSRNLMQNEAVAI